jgi:ubiquinone/menaquinone biosynthesis C-methylase UbiE
MPSHTTESNIHDTTDAHGTKDTWSATEYANTASFVYSDAFTQPILHLLSAKEGERIVDFGCGSGELTRVLADLVGKDGFVLGLDSSANMVSYSISARTIYSS